MAIAFTVNAFGSALGNSLGFIAKQGFCYTGLPGVRRELEDVVTQVAQEQFGWFVGSAIGSQVALMTSVPATIFLGDLIWSAVSEITQSAVYLTARAAGMVEETYQSLPTWIDIALKISSIAAGYFAKCLFAHHAMPIIRTGIESMLRHGWINTIPNPIIRTCLQTVAPFGAIMIAPTATFIAADIVGSLTQSLFYISTNTSATIAYNACFPQKSRLMQEVQPPEYLV